MASNRQGGLYLEEVFKYWGSRYSSVYISSPMVEFPHWGRKYLLDGSYEFRPNFEDHDRFYSVLQQTSVPENVTILNSRALFCEDENQCSGMNQEGQMLIIDYGHLSRVGAKTVGAKFLKEIQ